MYAIPRWRSPCAAPSCVPCSAPAGGSATSGSELGGGDAPPHAADSVTRQPMVKSVVVRVMITPSALQRSSRLVQPLEGREEASLDLRGPRARQYLGAVRLAHVEH